MILAAVWPVEGQAMSDYATMNNYQASNVKRNGNVSKIPPYSIITLMTNLMIDTFFTTIILI